MALQHLRSSTADKRPDPASMADGQLAINLESTSPGLFFKDSGGALVKAGPVHVGTTAPNAVPAGESGNSVGEFWLDTSGSTYTLKAYDGTAWRTVALPTAGGAFTGNVTLNAQSDLRFADGDSSNWVAFQAPTTIASDVTWTLPGADGTSGQVLSTNGSGTLSWISNSTDNITEGNTTAEVVDTGVDGHFKVTTEGSERLRITADGSLGLGTSSPSSLLEIAGNNSGNDEDYVNVNNAFRFKETDSTLVNGQPTGAILWETSDSSDAGVHAYIACRGSNTGAGQLAFGTGLASSLDTRLFISSTGNVGIGTTSPAALLDVTGSNGKALIANGAASDSMRFIAQNASGTGNAAMVFESYNLEYGRFDSSGRLLVGTSSALDTNAGRQLQVADANGAFLLLGRDDTTVGDGPSLGGVHFYGNDTTSNAWTKLGAIDCSSDGIQGPGDNPTKLVFSTTADGSSSPTERMRISSNGDVNVPGTFYSRYNAVFTWNSSAGIKAVGDGGTNTGGVGIETACSTTNTRHHISFSNGNGVVGSISTNGSATAYNTSSDYRLKENVVPLTGAADRLNQLQVHRFNFIADPGTTVDGFLAHEAEAVVPECVTGTKDEVDDDGNPVYQGIDQSKLVPLLTAALQEALAEIESLKARVTALEP